MGLDRFVQFDTIDHLNLGKPRQRDAYKVLTRYAVLPKLYKYDPLLVGTVPINIDIEGSDLDVICCYTDAGIFKHDVEMLFGSFDGFCILDTVINAKNSIVASFKLEEQEVEVFGQAIPVKQQNGYRHMIAEYDLLLKHGDPLRRQVIQFKQDGYKTEPAFAKALGLPGDPYQALLHFYPL